MLEWPPYSAKYTAKDIPQIIQRGFKPMTDSTNPVPGTEVTQTPGLIPETPTNIPGYDPSTASAPGEYVPPTDDHMTNDPYYDPANETQTDMWTENDGSTGECPPPPYETMPSVMNNGTVDPAYASAFPANPGYDPTNSEPPVYPNSDNAHNTLMEDPKYAVHVHEAQLNRIIACLEEIVNRLNDVDNKVLHLEEAVRFDHQQHHEHGGFDGPPESPTGTEYGQGT